MDISAILGEIDALSSGKRLMSISTDEERFVLPVTPWKYSVQLGQNNKTVDILDAGEMLVFGHRKLHRLKFSCFFPDLSHKYPYVLNDQYSPRECIEILNKFKMDEAPVHVILTDSPINQFFAINDISFREKDGSRDIDYDIDLIEYRDWTDPENTDYVKKVNNITGLRDRSGIRTTSSIQSFLENVTKDVQEVVKSITGSSGSIKSGGGKSDGTQELKDIANTYMAFSTGNFSPSSIASIGRVASNPIGVVKSGLKGVTNVVKSAVKSVGGAVGSVFKGIGSIFKW